MQLSITICDDEENQIKYLKNVVKSWAEKHNIIIQVNSFLSAEKFLFEYPENKSIDILLLDIEMHKMNGVTLAKHIRKDNDNIQIIFITGYPDYISQGYDVSALHYLMKPVKESKLFEVLDKAKKNLSKQSKMIYISVNGENVCIPVDNIIYIETFDHRIEIITTSEIYSPKMPLYELESMLTNNFIRCHRCSIVNLNYIKKISKTEIVLDNGKILPLSRRLYNDVNKAMMKYLRGGE